MTSKTKFSALRDPEEKNKLLYGTQLKLNDFFDKVFFNCSVSKTFYFNCENGCMTIITKRKVNVKNDPT